jgi:methylated-DNA-[protein]-cysteine S-methyltransferase
MNAYTSTFRTCFGLFSIAVDENGAVLATAFGNQTALRSRLKHGHVLRDIPSGIIPSQKRLRQAITEATTQISALLAGDRQDFDRPLAPEGSAFQKRVWTALSKIPRGETRSYGELAKALDTSARAIGRANATNPICLIVPCHRVIGADGSLTGFAFGEEIKQRLLRLEGVTIA